MNKQWAVCVAMVVWASSAMAVVTNRIQFGGNGADKNWANSVVTNNLVTPAEYSVSYGVPARYSESPISNLQFTVTFTETNGVPVYMGNNWLGAGYGTNTVDRRINGNEVIQLTVSYSDDNNKLLSLKAMGFGAQWNTQPHETTVFSDGINNFSLTDTSNDFIQDYDTTGLTQLSADNLSTWVMLVSVDDVLGGGTNFTESGMGALVLEYIADVDYIPETPELTPVFFDFVDGGEFDNKTLFPEVTMTRSNSWGSAITITTVDIIGQDGSSATNGTGNKTNIQSVDALGINSVVNIPITGDQKEPRDFNPNEAWVVTFDTEVYMVEIDLASESADAEMTISSSAFADIVMLGEGVASDGTFNLSDTYVPAGSTVMFQMTSSTNASDTSLRIDHLSLQVPGDAESYAAWAQEGDLVENINGAYGDDPDMDTMDNLMEFALGGDPLVDDATRVLPGYELSADGATSYLNYVYTRRIRRDVSGLNYAVGSTLNLVLEPAVNPSEEVGSGAMDAEYESVTNRVSTDVEAQQFMQLEVTMD